MLRQSLCYEQTNLIIKMPIINLLIMHHLPHLTRITSTPEIHKNNHPVNEQDKTHTEYGDEVSLSSRPGSLRSTLEARRQREIRYPGISHIEPQRKYSNREPQAK